MEANGWRAMRDVRLEARYRTLRTPSRPRSSGRSHSTKLTGSAKSPEDAPELDAGPVGIVGGFEAEPGAIELVSL